MFTVAVLCAVVGLTATANLPSSSPTYDTPTSSSHFGGSQSSGGLQGSAGHSGSFQGSVGHSGASFQGSDHSGERFQGSVGHSGASYQGSGHSGERFQGSVVHSGAAFQGSGHSGSGFQESGHRGGDLQGQTVDFGGSSVGGLVGVSSVSSGGRYHPSGPVIPILVDEREGPDQYGNYRFNFQTGDGISRHEQGTPEGPTGAVASQGGWSFTFPDGTPAVFNFVADVDGYRVESDLIPTQHPLPAHAIEQIEFARQQKASVVDFDDGSYRGDGGFVGPAQGGFEGPTQGVFGDFTQGGFGEVSGSFDDDSDEDFGDFGDPSSAPRPQLRPQPVPAPSLTYGAP